MIDLHVHSNFSSDSNEEMEDIIKEAINRNIEIIAFTDHIDYEYSDPNISFDFDISEYFYEIERLKNKYNSRIKILKGLELGLQSHIIEKLNKVSNKYEFDFIIGSFHTVERKDLYNGDYYKSKTPEEMWDVYLDEVYETIKNFNNFSVLGHLDLIKRYSESVREVDFSYYKNKLEKIFNIIIEKEIGIEVNTSGLRGNYGLNETLPSKEILKLYYDLGGRIITIGSDSHDKSTLGDNFNETLKFINNIGFKDIYVFEKMKNGKINI
ncbi:histidinol-phosphatase HisJ family protein [Clostridiaceae bacterium HSG29]|nr:histidinol-phosphatase HisJ family protein [Clostridiaceae bacterium HSG29]